LPPRPAPAGSPLSAAVSAPLPQRNPRQGPDLTKLPASIRESLAKLAGDPADEEGKEGKPAPPAAPPDSARKR
jgi:hypothetical protein